MRVQFLFDFGSPNAYLAHRVIPAVEQRTGVRFEYVPILLGGVFKLTGNASPAITMAPIKNRLEYEMLEVRRFVEHHDITDYRMNPHFPINTLQLMRGALVAAHEGCAPLYVDTVFRCMWVDGLKMDDPAVFRSALENTAGLDAETMLRGVGDPEIKAQLVKNTEDAVARGVFGAPSFFVGDDLFFGKDRLAQIEARLTRSGG